MEQTLVAEKTSMKEMLDNLSRGGIEKEQQLKTLSQEKSELAQKNSQREAELENTVDTLSREKLGLQSELTSVGSVLVTL